MQSDISNGCSYTLPLEVGWGDVHDIYLNDRITCQQVLDKLAIANDNSEPGVAKTYAILEHVYDATNRLREIRKLDPNQPMYQLVPFALAPKCSFERSVLSVVELGNEIVVFFNAYFRMLTGLPHEHLSFFPDAMMTVGECEQMIKNRLGLSQQEHAKVGLHGNYGNSVTALESSLLVSTLKRTHDDISSPKFFQFQVLANQADHELLGVSRASWLYVKEHKGLIHHERKLYAALKGTTMFLYKSEDKRCGRYGIIDRIDECRVLNLGHNALRTRHYLRLFHPSGVKYSLSSAYRPRINKWLTALNGCHRVLEVQDAVTAASLAGLPPEDEQNKRRRGKRIDPTDEVSEREPTEVQRELLEKAADTLKVLQADAKHFNASGIKEQWLETIRLFLVTICELIRPGFACDVLPLIKDVMIKIRNHHLEESNNQEEVDAIVDICIRVMAVYKSFVMDEAPIPTDLAEDDRTWGPRMKEMRNKLSQTEYYCKWEEACTTDDESLSVEAIFESIGPKSKKFDTTEADDEEYNGDYNGDIYQEAELELNEPLPMEEQVRCIQFPSKLPPPPPSERNDQSKSVLSKMARMFRKKSNSLDKVEEKSMESEAVRTNYPKGRQKIDLTTRVNYDDITRGNEMDEFDAEDELEWNYQPKSRMNQRNFGQYANSPMGMEEEYDPDEGEESSGYYQNQSLNYHQQQFNNPRGREGLRRMSYQELDSYNYDFERPPRPPFAPPTINKLPRARSYCDSLSEEKNYNQYQPRPIPNGNGNYNRTKIRGSRPQMRPLPLPGLDNGGTRMMMTPRPMPSTMRNRR